MGISPRRRDGSERVANEPKLTFKLNSRVYSQATSRIEISGQRHPDRRIAPGGGRSSLLATQGRYRLGFPRSESAFASHQPFYQRTRA